MELSRPETPTTRGSSGFPQLPALDLWRDLYRQAARANGGEPDAGRRLLSWALAAGFDDIDADRQPLVLRDARGPANGGAECGPTGFFIRASARDLLRLGLATPAQLEEISAAWRAWAAAPDGWLAIPHGEIICRA